MISTIGDRTPKLASDCFVAPNATVLGDVAMGRESSIWFGAVVRGDSNVIKIGAGSNVQDLCVLHVDETNSLKIGDLVTVGHRATLHGCTVEDNVLIGMCSTVMNGAVIGKESIVGAGALVIEGTKIPPRSLVLGVPAKVKRQLTSDEILAIDTNARQYIEKAAQYRKCKLREIVRS